MLKVIIIQSYNYSKLSSVMSTYFNLCVAQKSMRLRSFPVNLLFWYLWNRSRLKKQTILASSLDLYPGRMLDTPLTYSDICKGYGEVEELQSSSLTSRQNSINKTCILMSAETSQILIRTPTVQKSPFASLFQHALLLYTQITSQTTF